MNAAVRKSQRFARVRAAQHNLAAVAAHKAAKQVEALEASIGKLVSLRDGMRAAPGPVAGASLAATGEIAMRLDQARATVAASAANARIRSLDFQQALLAARVKQESADRLTGKAIKAAEQQVERKLAARSLRRKRSQES